MARSLEQTQNENHNNIIVTSAGFTRQFQNTIGFDITPESLEPYGVEGNVEDDYIKDERPKFV